MTHSITVDAVTKPKTTVVVITTFRLYRNDLQSLQMLFQLSSRISRETGLDAELLLHGDKTLHLTSRCEITREALLEKVERAIAIIKELYDMPRARTQIQQGLF